MFIKAKVLCDHLTGNVINVGGPAEDGYSPIPDAQWVEHLGVSSTDLSNWLSDSISDPSDPTAIYAGVGSTGAMYIVHLHGGQ